MPPICPGLFQLARMGLGLDTDLQGALPALQDEWLSGSEPAAASHESMAIPTIHLSSRKWKYLPYFILASASPSREGGSPQPAQPVSGKNSLRPMCDGGCARPLRSLVQTHPSFASRATRVSILQTSLPGNSATPITPRPGRRALSGIACTCIYPDPVALGHVRNQYAILNCTAYHR